MRRYIVGLLATVGTLTLLIIAGGVALMISAPFSAKPLPQTMVLSLDLRRLPPEVESTGLLRGSLLGGSRDIIEVTRLLSRAADDPRVAGLYVEIGDDQAGLARVQELRQALAHFRGKGKFTVGFAESLGGDGHVGDYYLAAALEQIWLQPSGSFAVTGIAIETPFLKAGLEKIGVQMEGGKRYQYKSAPDSFLETGYTGPARENLQQLLDSLFGQFAADVASDRRLEPAQVRRLVDSAPFGPERARQEGLIDRIGYRADAIEEVRQRSGSSHDLVSLADYAGDAERPMPQGEVIALVRVNGPIVSGPSDDGGLLEGDAVANAEDVVDALDQAAQAKEVRAIVLRIDSPGGTYPAADAIADAVGRARAAGKPVIASMSDVAASGGYLAAVRADVIVAQPTSITASIGVFTIWPVASELLTSLGIRMERLSVGANAGMYSTFQPPTAAQRMIVARELDTVYRDFAREVGESRKLDAGQLDAAARGRVFSGVDAKQAGLVDELGGLQLALSIAKAKAGIDEIRQIELRPYPGEGERWQRLLDQVLRLANVDSGPTVRAPREVREILARFGVVARPGNVRLPPLPPLWR